MKKVDHFLNSNHKAFKESFWGKVTYPWNYKWNSFKKTEVKATFNKNNHLLKKAQDTNLSKFNKKRKMFQKTDNTIVH